MFSNRYIFIFASVMVIIVALLLSLTATILQPYQQKNLEVEKMKDILGASQIFTETKNIPDFYKKHIKEEIVVDTKGEIIAIFKNGEFEIGSIRAFNLNLKEEIQSISKNNYGLLPLYVVENNSDVFYVIPMLGRGLWGPLWGTIALNDDLSSVYGVTFGHKSETPGLGAEISTKEFQKQFIDKKIFNDNNEFVSVSIVKGGVGNSKISKVHAVDGISGGTITSDGTAEMIYSCLKNYLPFFEKIKKNATK